MDIHEDNLFLEAEKNIPKNYDVKLYKIRHSLAHIMAQAVTDFFHDKGEVYLGIGPPIENGFYYDFQTPYSLNEGDLEKIEQRMKEIIHSDVPFRIKELTSEEALEMFKNSPFKLELIHDLISGKSDEHGNKLIIKKKPIITIYQQDNFIDLCQGPHVKSTGEIDPDAFKLLRIAGAYWHGDSNRPQLQRIYGTAWEKKDDLEKYLWQHQEAEKRDHRVLGKQLELFHLDETAPGMPYWLPKGLKILNILLGFWRNEHEKRGYQEISAPLVNSKRLWEISGHIDHYKENMFFIPMNDNITYALKPMNCPNAMIIYNLKPHSYRDLPLRFSDCDILHRKEASGSLLGLLRVQHIQQDDAHIFLKEEQVEEEYDRILELTELFYKVFGLKYRFRLGTRPESYIGEIETWVKAENALKNILNKHVGNENYIIADGDGAFYGPKIDILMEDSLNREWQMGTIQLDFQLPQRFNCRYSDSDNKEKVPVVIHRVIYGSFERFIGILIEHYAGSFPLWLSPVQTRVIGVSDAVVPYIENVCRILQESSIRTEVDLSAETLNKKIRNAQIDKIPYMIIIGNREAKNGTISIRTREEKQYSDFDLSKFIEILKNKVITKTSILDV